MKPTTITGRIELPTCLLVSKDDVEANIYALLEEERFCDIMVVNDAVTSVFSFSKRRSLSFDISEGLYNLKRIVLQVFSDRAIEATSSLINGKSEEFCSVSISISDSVEVLERKKESFPIALPRTSGRIRSKFAASIARSIMVSIIALGQAACGTEFESDKSVSATHANNVGRSIDDVMPKKEFNSVLASFLLDFQEDARRYGVEEIDSGEIELRVLKYAPKSSMPDSKRNDSGVTTLGFCRIYSAQKNKDVKHWGEVYILEDKDNPIMITDKTTDTEKYFNMKSLVYHELAHCLLNANHRSKYDSIMTPLLQPDDQSIDETWDERVEELFNSDEILGPHFTK